MTTTSPEPSVRLRVHLAAAPATVFRALSTAEGRRGFWADSADEVDGAIRFRFGNGVALTAPIRACDPPHRFAVGYFGGSTATFELAPDGAGGTDLTLVETGIRLEDFVEQRAGWVTVLLALKAAVDFGIDLRNHDPERRWEHGYVDV